MKKSVLLIFLLFSINSYAQEIKGIIIDKETSLPIKDVEIIDKQKAAQRISTKSKGKFILPLSHNEPRVEIMCTHPHYEDYEDYVEVKTENCVILLEPKKQEITLIHPTDIVAPIIKINNELINSGQDMTVFKVRKNGRYQIVLLKDKQKWVFEFQGELQGGIIYPNNLIRKK